MRAARTWVVLASVLSCAGCDGPAPPHEIEIRAETFGAVSLSWEPVSAAGELLYEARAVLPDTPVDAIPSGVVSWARTSRTEAILAGLTNGELVEVSVRARTLNGPGRWSDPIPVTPQDPVIGSPVGVEVLIPAGWYRLGSDDGPLVDASPEQEIFLSAFWIDAAEVTVDEYRDCLDAEVCPAPRTDLGGNPGLLVFGVYDDFPVAPLDWDAARTYCEFAGKRLPTEAEWEAAARGVGDAGFPWGSEPAACDRARFDAGFPCASAPDACAPCSVQPAPVGGLEGGRSPYGLYDVAGNVSEWVSDFYGGSYYMIRPERNPPGPEVPDLVGERGVRGGSWDRGAFALDVSFRGHLPPDLGDFAAAPALPLPTTSLWTGVRCARSVEE